VALSVLDTDIIGKSEAAYFHLFVDYVDFQPSSASRNQYLAKLPSLDFCVLLRKLRAKMDTGEFGAFFWLSVIGAILGFGGVAMKAMLKSRCTKVTMGCFSCERDASANDADVSLDVPEFDLVGR